MSLFRSMMGDMVPDPFFGNHMRRMDQMMDSMMQPFGSMFPPMPGTFPALTNNSNSLLPLSGFGGSLFPSVNHMFSNIQNMANNPNCHSYSSSSVMTYTMDGNGRPQVYEATSSTHSAPGGVKETRKTMRDSKTGEQQMSIGHHIQEKAHIVEKSRNMITGQRDETEEFINIEEDQADEFNREWVSRTQQSSRPRITAIENSTNEDEREVEIIEVPTSASPLAITAGPSQSQSHHMQRQPHPAHHHSRKRERHELATDSHKASNHRNKKTGHKRSSKHSHLPRYESHM